MAPDSPQKPLDKQPDPAKPGVGETPLNLGPLGTRARPGADAELGRRIAGAPAGGVTSLFEVEQKAVRLRRIRAAKPAAKARPSFADVELKPEAPVSTWDRLWQFAKAAFARRPDPAPNPAPPVPNEGPPAAPARLTYIPNLSGLALSGGGIRSATFALGFLQGLSQSGLLRKFDYLSTVSGGGYIGGWWSAWLARRPTPEVASDDRTKLEHELDERYAERLFPPDELIEPQRTPPLVLTRDEPAPPQPDDGSLFAAMRDPIRHVRMFSNYLTPRRGLLSIDTWRAVTIITRNLALTWLVLLPVLFAATLTAQLYFMAPTLSRSPSTASISPAAVTADSTSQCAAVVDSTSAPEATDGVRARLHHVEQPLIVLFAWMVLLTGLWIAYSARPWPLGILGLLVFALIVALTVLHTTPKPSGLGDQLWTSVFVVGSLILLFTFGVHVPWTVWKQHRDPDPEATRNWILRIQASMLVTAVGLAVILGIAGFGYDILTALVGPGSAVDRAVGKAGGLLAFVVAGAPSVYTALKNAPTVRGANVNAAESAVNRAIFALAPVLLLVSLLIGFSALGHAIMPRPVDTSAALCTTWQRTWTNIHWLSGAALSGVGLALLFACYEWIGVASTTRRAKRNWIERFAIPIGDRLRAIEASVAAVVLFVLLAAVSAAAALFTAGGPHGPSAPRATLGGFLALVIVGLRLAATKGDDASVLGLQARWKHWATYARSQRILIGIAVITALVGLGIAATSLMADVAEQTTTDGSGVWIARVAWGLLHFIVLFTLAELVFSHGDRRRATGLSVFACLIAGSLLCLHYLPHHYARIVRLASTTPFGPDLWAPTSQVMNATFLVSLIGLAVGSVVALGWLVDPNVVSLHAFYKARLVRAYLGASNVARRIEDITVGVAGDDVRLQELRNAERGAAIHLVNTTLNLVGARDLSTAQRSAAPFILSRYLCGSIRTGYRPTAEYMSGKMMLGTAVAASGAAVSPNMGAKTRSSALSLLMALFNVRLGVWVPTPNRHRWFEPQTRLWPFYLLRESLSQTNTLSSYCYLTDGGHFENTGLYALVERACMNIVIVDAGEDQTPNFADMGDAIRKCRIDFGAEVKLPKAFSKFMPMKDGGSAEVHLAVGRVRYARAHLEALGFDERDIDQHLRGRMGGTVVWVKPAVTARDPLDLLQFRVEKPPFPQDTTLNQWFSEAQFESYRALGCVSALVLRRSMRRHREPFFTRTMDGLTVTAAKSAATT